MVGKLLALWPEVLCAVYLDVNYLHAAAIYGSCSVSVPEILSAKLHIPVKVTPKTGQCAHKQMIISNFPVQHVAGDNKPLLPNR